MPGVRVLQLPLLVRELLSVGHICLVPRLLLLEQIFPYRCCLFCGNVVGTGDGLTPGLLDVPLHALMFDEQRRSRRLSISEALDMGPGVLDLIDKSLDERVLREVL